jgi:hypothetical protein
MSGPLGRLTPPDFDHVEKYPLSALLTEAPMAAKNVPVIAGVNWYGGFDSPERDQSSGEDVYWIGRNVPLGNIRGGHCFALEPTEDSAIPGKEQDSTKWWEFYDQGREGACVGFGCSRAMTLMNRRRYDAFWLYHRAQEVGGYVGTEGAYVRDGLEVLRTDGHRVQNLDKTDEPPRGKDGIDAYRWITPAEGAQGVLNALGTPNLDYVTILNSWGLAYPHRVRMPATVLDRLIQESGEVGVVTDR